MSSSTPTSSIDAQPSSRSATIAKLNDLRDVLRGVKEATASGQVLDAPVWDDDNEGYFTPPEYTQSQNDGEENTSTPLVNKSLESDEEDDDLTPLEYARLHGLSRDHLSDSSAFTHIEALQADIWEDVLDDFLPQFNFGAEPRLDERLTLSKEAARLLQAVAHQETRETIDALILPILGSSEVSDARVELPLLKTDHETDCKHFAQWDGFEIKLKDVKFPVEAVDDEKNEGIKFPSAYWHLGDKIMEELKKEKLEVSRNTMVFLKEALMNVWTKADDEALWQAEMKYKRVSLHVLNGRYLIMICSEHCLRASNSTTLSDVSSTSALRTVIVVAGIST